METQDNIGIVNEKTQLKPTDNNSTNNNKGGFFSFFRFGKNKTEAPTKVKVEQPTETGKIDIKVEPSTPAKPTTKKPVNFNEINLYEEEPSIKDVPLDIYDDTIRLEPQNVKNVKYDSIDDDEKIDSNLNNVNLYESTPELKKTFFRKIKESIAEVIRLIKAGINGIFAFIWALFGGIITGIFVFFRNLAFNIMRSFIKFMIKSERKKPEVEVASRSLSDVKDETSNLWDINRMVITNPVYQAV